MRKMWHLVQKWNEKIECVFGIYVQENLRGICNLSRDISLWNYVNEIRLGDMIYKIHALSDCNHWVLVVDYVIPNISLFLNQSKPVMKYMKIQRTWCFSHTVQTWVK